MLKFCAHTFSYATVHITVCMHRDCQNQEYISIPLPEFITSLVHLPLSELLVEKPVWESLSADTDALQDTVAPQLVEHEVGINETRPLHLIWNDTPDKVGSCIAEGSHETVEGCLVVLSHRDEAGTLLASWALALCEVVSPEGHDEGIRGFFEQFNNGIIQRVFVLVQPANDSVANLYGGQISCIVILLSLSLSFSLSLLSLSLFFLLPPSFVP